MSEEKYVPKSKIGKWFNRSITTINTWCSFK